LRGTGLYSVINTANHSCAPNAAAASTTIDHSLALIAQSAVRGGEEITIAYCDEQSAAQQATRAFARAISFRVQLHLDARKDHEIL
jgi:hypothetical protein